MAKNTYNYFDAFVRMVDYSCQTAKILHQSLLEFDPKTLPEKMKQLHQLEHKADMEKHDVMHHLVREFLPPIEREDIIQLAQEIDDVTDSLEEVLMMAYMYNMQALRPEALKFTETICACCSSLKTAMEEFHNFRKSTVINDNIIEVNHLEEEGDTLYTESMHTLFASTTNAVELIAWTKTFDRLEACFDACEHVANTMETIIMKNS